MTNDNIKIIEVPRHWATGTYAANVIEHGHETGVLSGAEIRGRARQFGGWYYRKRQEVQRKCASIGVYKTPFPAHRGATLWADEAGNRVRLVLV